MIRSRCVVWRRCACVVVCGEVGVICVVGSATSDSLKSSGQSVCICFWCCSSAVECSSGAAACFDVLST